jgi:hypothetical protein
VVPFFWQNQFRSGHFPSDPQSRGIYFRVAVRPEMAGDMISRPAEGDCVKKTRNRHAVRKMKVDPSEPPVGGGFRLP